MEDGNVTLEKYLLLEITVFWALYIITRNFSLCATIYKLYVDSISPNFTYIYFRTKKKLWQRRVVEISPSMTHELH